MKVTFLVSFATTDCVGGFSKIKFYKNFQFLYRYVSKNCNSLQLATAASMRLSHNFYMI